MKTSHRFGKVPRSCALGLAALLLARPGRSVAAEPLATGTIKQLSLEAVGRQDVRFQERARAHQRSEVIRLLESARQHYRQRSYERAATLFATAFLFDADADAVYWAGQSCLRASWDTEALAILLRVLDDPAAASHHAEATEKLGELRRRVEDPEAQLTHVVKERIDAARRSFEAGRYATAGEELALAYVARPLPRLLFNIAQTYRRAERAEEAYVLYSRFLQEDPQSPLRREAAGYVCELRTLAFVLPIYKRPWFWGVIATGTAAVLAGGVSLAVSLSPKDPMTTGGIFNINIR